MRKKDGTGRHPLNVNIHKPDTPGPAIVNELDRLLLATYGFAPEPLIGQMTTIREEGAHRLTVDAPNH